jgi:hypothetical protein
VSPRLACGMPMRRTLPLQLSLAAFSLAIGNGSMM